MNINEQERKQTWVIGVSGGSDSMALLAMCIKASMSVVVAHMNYQKRASANRDMEGVIAFCEKYDVPCVVKLQEKPCVGNFQAFARNERYAFYHEVIKQYHAQGVLIAHQMDDHLETYLMQQKRGSIPRYYGIERSTVISACNVLRPLLDYTKTQLETYCEQNHIPYYIDESNLSDHYTRNRIRHQIIETMSLNDKLDLYNEIAVKNEGLAKTHKQVAHFLHTWKYDVQSLKQFDEATQLMILQTWIHNTTHAFLSLKELRLIYHRIGQGGNWERPIHQEYVLRCAYEILSIEKQKVLNYSYTYDTLMYTTTPYFTCAKHGASTEAVTLREDDFPITIRSVQKQDEIVMRFGKKRLNRWFIDRKIPPQERITWPVVVNRDGKIILVPKIGCDISHFSNNPNLFVIK